MKIEFGNWENENAAGLISRKFSVDKHELGSLYGYQVARREASGHIRSIAMEGHFQSVTDRDEKLCAVLAPLRKLPTLLDVRLAAARLAQWSR